MKTSAAGEIRVIGRSVLRRVHHNPKKMLWGASLPFTVHAPASDLGTGLDARGQIGRTATMALGCSPRRRRGWSGLTERGVRPGASSGVRDPGCGRLLLGAGGARA